VVLMPNSRELSAEIERLTEEYARFIEAQTPAAFHFRPGPTRWTAAELTGHVAEFPVTFSGQALRLSRNPSLQLGRSLDDPGRLAAVARLAGAGPTEAAEAVRQGGRQAAETLRQIRAEGWLVTGQHSRLGEISVSQVVEQFIISHLREHLGQARATVAASGNW
jgi:hypothetical protein